MNYQDTICVCGHWFEEHRNGVCDGCGSLWEDTNVPLSDAEWFCKGFAYSDEWNTPENIANRGGEHSDDCQCALCVSERAIA